MSRMSTMEKVVKKDIEDNIKNVENVVKTVALIAQQKGADSGAIMQICDSIVVRTPDIERAYVAFSDSDNYGNKELNECIRIAKSKKISLWSSPHYVTKRSNQSPVTTFLTPLINEKGEVKGVLCADINLDWLKKIADKEIESGNAYITVADKEWGCYLAFQKSNTTNRSKWLVLHEELYVILVLKLRELELHHVGLVVDRHVEILGANALKLIHNLFKDSFVANRNKRLWNDVGDWF